MSPRAVVVAAALLTGCGSMPVGEACDEVLRAYCGRAMTCLGGTSADLEACVSAGVPECCGKAGTCQRDVRDSAAVGRCVDASNAQSCAAWQAWVQASSSTPPPLPGVCVGVAQPR
jgi:hypothetical protein